AESVHCGPMESLIGHVHFSLIDELVARVHCGIRIRCATVDATGICHCVARNVVTMDDLHALPTRPLTLAAGQAGCAALDIAANVATAVDLVRRAAGEGAALLLL